MISINCNSCGVFIKNIELSQISNLTGKEICKNCARKFGDIRAELQKLHLGYKKKIDALHDEALERLEEIKNTPIIKGGKLLREVK